jgi:molybdate transport system substrate-binding protein
MRRLTILLAALALAGCGEDEAPLKVSAAASLKAALTAYDREARFSFAGSDELAAQIRQGARPDVFAAANTKLPQQLFEAGLVEKPRVFAANRLVLAVPADGSVRSLTDVEADGVQIAVGAEAVPIGAYTREVLARLSPDREEAIAANFASEEPDVAGVVAKLTQGAVEAGFVYATDVKAADGKLRGIDLPADLQPEIAYGVAVVKGTKRREAARAFVDGLLDGKGAQALIDAGFQSA